MENGEIKQNGHWGPTLKSFLEEEGMLEEANAYATEKIQAWEDTKSAKEEQPEEKPMYYIPAESYDEFIKIIFGPEKPANEILEGFICKSPPKEKK